jgi:hypothetical protein
VLDARFCFRPIGVISPTADQVSPRTTSRDPSG